MSVFVLCFFAASGGMTLGILAGSSLAAGKVQDLDSAYHRLSQQMHHYLRVRSAASSCESPECEQALHSLRSVLEQSDEAVGLRPARKEWP